MWLNCSLQIMLNIECALNILATCRVQQQHGTAAAEAAGKNTLCLCSIAESCMIGWCNTLGQLQAAAKGAGAGMQQLVQQLRAATCGKVLRLLQHSVQLQPKEHQPYPAPTPQAPACGKPCPAECMSPRPWGRGLSACVTCTRGWLKPLVGLALMKHRHLWEWHAAGFHPNTLLQRHKQQ
jgi:hypothetical protein